MDVYGVLSEQPSNQIGPAYAFQFLDYLMAAVGIVPEEELALGLLFAVGPGREDGLHCVGVDSGVEDFRAKGHGRGRKVLNLLQVEIQPFGDYRQQGHVLFSAGWMAAYEIGNELLVKAVLPVYPVKRLLELLELCE